MNPKTINFNGLIKIAMASALLCVGVARAEDGVLAREKRQEARIDADLAAGKITPEQAQKLKAKEQRIEKFREKATKDGKLSKKDKRKMERMENKVSKKIRHDEWKNRGVASANGSSSAPKKEGKRHHKKGAGSSQSAATSSVPAAPSSAAPSTTPGK